MATDRKQTINQQEASPSWSFEPGTATLHDIHDDDLMKMSLFIPRRGLFLPTSLPALTL